MTTTRENVTFISEIFIKIAVGICTILLTIAVGTLKSMNSEIKDLSKSVQTLTVETQVVLMTIKTLEKRVDKIEQDYYKIRK